MQLRIGYLIGYEGKELQDTIYEFTEEYPEVVLSVAKYSHEDLFKKISSNEIDLVLSYQRRAFLEEYERFEITSDLFQLYPYKYNFLTVP